MKTLINSEDAPIAVGAYSPGLSVGEWIFLSGQGGFDPKTGKMRSTGKVPDLPSQPPGRRSFPRRPVGP
jgi:enamine deaminase RidA (YjgF/YER057c/UK114 family)